MTTYDDNSKIRVDLRVLVNDKEYISHSITDAWPVEGEPVEKRIKSTIKLVSNRAREDF